MGVELWSCGAVEPGGLVDSDWPFVLFHCSLLVTQGRVGNKIWGRGDGLPGDSFVDVWWIGGRLS